VAEAPFAPSSSPPSFCSLLRETSDSSGPIGGNHFSRLLKVAAGPSGFTGVYPMNNRWQAHINYGGKQHHLGTFDTKECGPDVRGSP
jgi:hypothetical protein